MRECFDELVELEAAETGKIVAALRSEISGSMEFFEYYAAVVRGLRGQSLEPAAGSFAFVRREPYGVVAVVTPWNGRLNQACREAAPALAVGNTVVIKPSASVVFADANLDRAAQTVAAGFTVNTGQVSVNGGVVNSEASIRKIMQDNAAKLYNIPLPTDTGITAGS